MIIDLWTKHLEEDIWELRPGNNRVLFFFFEAAAFDLLAVVVLFLVTTVRFAAVFVVRLFCATGASVKAQSSNNRIPVRFMYQGLERHKTPQNLVHLNLTVLA